jgi:hypothetical protein
LQALRARHDVDISVQGGWTIVNDRANNTLWSFAPEGNPAYRAEGGAEARPCASDGTGSRSIQFY